MQVCVTEYVDRSAESLVCVLELTAGGAVGLFGGRLNVRIVVITSLMMSGCCGGVLGQLCGDDEFYDAVVDDCALCTDVCDLCRVPQSATFCAINCPGQTQIHCRHKDTNRSRFLPVKIFIIYHC